MAHVWTGGTPTPVPYVLLFIPLTPVHPLDQAQVPRNTHQPRRQILEELGVKPKSRSTLLDDAAAKPTSESCKPSRLITVDEACAHPDDAVPVAATVKTLAGLATGNTVAGIVAHGSTPLPTAGCG